MSMSLLASCYMYTFMQINCELKFCETIGDGIVCYLFIISSCLFSANIFAGESKSACTRKRSKDKELAKVDITFTNFFDKEISDIFAPPHNPKSLLLPENRPPCANKLPEDCHYQPEDLVKLFLLPNILV